MLPPCDSLFRTADGFERPPSPNQRHSLNSDTSVYDASIYQAQESRSVRFSEAESDSATFGDHGLVGRGYPQTPDSISTNGSHPDEACEEQESHYFDKMRYPHGPSMGELGQLLSGVMLCQADFEPQAFKLSDKNREILASPVTSETHFPSSSSFCPQKRQGAKHSRESALQQFLDEYVDLEAEASDKEKRTVRQGKNHAMKEQSRREQSIYILSWSALLLPNWLMVLIKKRSCWEICKSTNNSSQPTKNTLLFGLLIWCLYLQVLVILLLGDLPAPDKGLATLIIDWLGLKEEMTYNQAWHEVIQEEKESLEERKQERDVLDSAESSTSSAHPGGQRGQRKKRTRETPGRKRFRR